MKAIDLLNKIANGEIKEGFRVKRKNQIYEYREGKNYFINIKQDNYIYSLGDFTKLNEEVEIVEEKKEINLLDISRLRQNEYCYPITVEIMAKINEITNAVNEMRADYE